MVRGLVLLAGPPAVPGGYAQLRLAAAADAPTYAARIASALDASTTLPVVICCHERHGDAVAAEIVDALKAVGFESVEFTPREVAIERVGRSGTIPTQLDGVEIPQGLLTSHEGLTVGDLVAVAGAALIVLAAPSTAATEPAVAVWSPTTPAPPVPDADPFTAEPSDPEVLPDYLIPGRVVDEVSRVEDADDITAGGGAHEIGFDGEDNEVGFDGEDDVTKPAPPDARAAIAAAVTAARAGTDDGHDADTASAVDEDAGAGAGADVDAESSGESATVDAAAAAPTDRRSAPDPITEADRARFRSVIPWVVGALVAVALIGLLVSQCGGGDDLATTDEVAIDEQVTQTPVTQQSDGAESAESRVAAADAGAVEEPVTDPTVDPTPEASPTVEPTAESTATVAPTPTAEPTAEPLEELPPLSSLPERGAIFRPPTLFLEGPVQTQEQADALYEAAIAVVGPDNVVNNYVVRSDAPPAIDGNVRVEQAVLFESGSAVIAEQFIPTLELGVAVMALNPQVQMLVEGHTDSVGSDESNLELSQRRAEAVLEYLVGRGVDPTRLTSQGYGESDPVASNDNEEGRRTNRRIEVDLIDLLSGE